MDQNWLLASPPLKQRTKRRSTELNFCLHNVRSVRNQTNDVYALLEVNEISSGVYGIVDYEQLKWRLYSKAVLSPWIFVIVHQGLKEEVEFASFTDMISI